MESVKKVQIITGSVYTKKVIELLEEEGSISGYSIIPNIIGKGPRGLQDGSGLHNAFNNSMILVACSEEQLNTFIEPLRKLMNKVGGVCLVDDCSWLIQNK
jgi:nitrogen regulatory protein PII